MFLYFLSIAKGQGQTALAFPWRLSRLVFLPGFHMYACEGNVEISAIVGAALQRAGVCLSEQWQRGTNHAFDHSSFLIIKILD